MFPNSIQSSFDQAVNFSKASDTISDISFVFRFGYDNLAWKQKSGSLQDPVCLTSLSEAGEGG